MNRMFTASVLADSISPEGHRVTTVEVVYPHAVHKDLLRHRCMNRNVESFRAQKPENLIKSLLEGHAFKPEVFAQRIPGMGQGEQINEADYASALWDRHVLNCVETANEFLKLGIAKQQINFVLQDICPLSEIITATDWSNFYALRCELNDDGIPVARPEVYLTACAIRDAIALSKPVPLYYGMMHLPLLTKEELGHLCAARNEIQHDSVGMQSVERQWIFISAGRCARWSYGEYKWWEEDTVKGYERAIRLLSDGHMSPFEQQAKPFSFARWDLVEQLQHKVHKSMIPSIEREEIHRQLEYSGNLHGWSPARKGFRNEHDYSIVKTEFATL